MTGIGRPAGARGMLPVLLAVLVTTVTLGAGARASGRPADGAVRAADGAVTLYRAPVAPLRVLRGFSPPSTRFGAGHLGVDLAAGGAVPAGGVVRAGGLVRAAGPGTVTLAGPVAGRGVVVVAHPDGIRTEYEPVRPVVTRGEQVTAGQVLGTVDGTHRGCPASCLHWGARRGGVYLDPLLLLRPLGPVRLLPWSG